MRYLALIVGVLAAVGACGKDDDSGKAAATTSPGEDDGVAEEECDAEIAGPVDGPLIMTRECSPFVVNHDGMLEVDELEVEPGVEIRFLGDSGLALVGEFRVAGTEQAPVRLVALDEGSAWKGITFGPEARGTIEHGVVRGATGAALRQSLVIGRGAVVTLENVSVEVGRAPVPDGADQPLTAIHLDGEAGDETHLEGVSLAGYPRGVVTMGGSAGALGQGNDLGSVEIFGGTIDASVTFVEGTEYVLGRVDVAGEGSRRPLIRMQPGTTVSFRSMGWLRLERAVLEAVGVEGRPVRLVGVEGTWGGLRLGPGTRGSKLRRAVVVGAATAERDAAVYVDQGGELLVTEVVFRDLSEAAEAAVAAHCEATVNVSDITTDAAKPVIRPGGC